MKKNTRRNIQMTQEPWNEEIYPTRTAGSRKERGRKAAISTRILTFLIALFTIVIIVITVVAFYLSNGGSNTDSTKEFYNTSSTSQAAQSQASSTSEQAGEEASSQASSTEQTTASSTTTSSATTGDTLTVESGEGAASIAERAGITVEQLYALNPDKMTTGSWFANPGDTVKIK